MPTNTWSVVDGAQRGQPKPHRPIPYVPGPQAGPAATPRSDNKGLTIAAIVLAPIAVALLVGAMVYFYFSGPKGASSADSSSSQSVQSASAKDFSTSSTAKQGRRAERFQPPSNWRHCSGSGDSGDLNLVYAEDVDGNATTCQFATNVRNSFVEQYRLTRKFNDAVTTNSPTAGKTYTMICHDNSEVVTRTGGANVTVHII